MPLTVLVDTGYGNPRLCRVVAPTGSTVVAVLEAAQSKASAAELPCVSGLVVNGQGVVTALNGVANSAGHEWVASSSAAFESPPGTQKVDAGDFIRLRFPKTGGLEATGASMSFGEQAEGTIGRGKTVYVRISEAPTEPRFSVTGAQREDFVVSAGDCQGAAIEPGMGCTVGVRFAPSVTGAATASLHLMNANGNYGPPVALSGIGIAATTGQGPAGPAGPAGATGATGAAGPAGERGPTGPAGAKGDAGPAGPQGERGPRGKAGKSAAKKKAARKRAARRAAARKKAAAKREAARRAHPRRAAAHARHGRS